MSLQRSLNTLRTTRTLNVISAQTSLFLENPRNCRQFSKTTQSFSNSQSSLPHLPSGIKIITTENTKLKPKKLIPSKIKIEPKEAPAEVVPKINSEKIRSQVEDRILSELIDSSPLPVRRPLVAEKTESVKVERTSEEVRNFDTSEFDALWIDPAISRTLFESFGITTPTSGQKSILRAIKLERDAIIRDSTGSGKTFAVLVGLISRHLADFVQSVTTDKQDKDTAKIDVIILPSIEVIQQLFVWSRRILGSQSIRTAYPTFKSGDPEFLQVHYKCEKKKYQANQISKLQSHTPRILLCTPTRLRELYKNEGLLDIKRIRTVVVDEVDQVADFNSKYASTAKRLKNFNHPSAGELFLRDLMNYRDSVIESSTEAKEAVDSDVVAKDQEIDFDNEEVNQPSEIIEPAVSNNQQPIPSKSPVQFIAMSASLNSNIRSQLTTVRKWARNPITFDSGANNISKLIEHHCYVITHVGPYSLTDLHLGDEKEIAVHFPEMMEEFATPRNTSIDAVWKDKSFMDSFVEIMNLFDVKKGLVVLDYEDSVDNMIHCLKVHGIDSERIDLALARFSGDDEYWPMMVGTSVMARGLDIENISHVFSVSRVRDSNGYLHLAGRTGRMGKSGTVVTVIKGLLNARKMRNVYQQLQIPLTSNIKIIN